MNREITNVLSTGLDIYNSIICLFMILSIRKKSVKSKGNFYFVAVCASIIALNLGDLTNWTCEGTKHLWNIPLLHIGTFIFYASVPVAFLFLMRYIEEYIKPAYKNHSIFIISHIISITYEILTVISIFADFFYNITPDNYYHRGRFNIISWIYFMVFYTLSVSIVFIHRKSISKKATFYFLSYSFFPIAGQLLQIKFYGITLVTTAMTFSLLLIFMNLHRALEINNEQMEKEIHNKEKSLIKFQEHTIASLSNLVENRDLETGEHAQRTSLIVRLLAMQAKADKVYPEIITDSYIKLMVQAAPMHDIGKITVSDTILKKNGSLTDNEFKEMKIHALKGGKIIQNIIGYSDDKEYLKVATNMAKSHHERWDGTGYPENLKGQQIPVCARIMAIADVFDALIYERCYKDPVPTEKAFEIIESEAGTHFDPVLVEEFLKIKAELIRVMCLTV